MAKRKSELSSSWNKRRKRESSPSSTSSSSGSSDYSYFSINENDSSEPSSVEDNDDNIDEIRVENSPTAGPSSYKCDYCPSQYQTEQELKHHVQQVHPQRNQLSKCKYCRFTSPNYYGNIFYLIFKKCLIF